MENWNVAARIILMTVLVLILIISDVLG